VTDRANVESRIDSQIATHRGMYRDDLFIERLVARQPPTTLDLNTGQLHVEDGTRIGMTMSGRLLKYVGHPDGFGADFPWSKALYRLRWHCRKHHEFHRASDRPYWRGSLCHQLVTFTVIRGFSVQNAAEILRYDNPEPVLREALQWIEDAMDRARQKAERRQRDEQGSGPGAVPEYVPAHHAPSQEHVEECPNPECRRRRAA
jgi:hypothetical protein